MVVDAGLVERLRDALAGRGVTMEYLESGALAFARLRELVPLGSEVQTGSSTTLEQIGFIAWLKEHHSAGRLHYFRADVINNAAERTLNRRLGTLAEYFLGSVTALTVDGLAVVSDAAGSRLGGYVYSAARVIWVVGINKIVPTLDDAIRRVWDVALPLEDARIKSTGGEGSEVGKLAIFYNEAATERIRMLLVGEALGF
ncbi:MAG TPA: LUD domain-containing protein [Chloroflexota bacterium]|jgi:DNA-binding MarR family transcriptional regulator